MIDMYAHRWALVMAHPGHELRAFHFVECTKPLVAVLTDGSGSHGVSRISETAQLLAELGATAAPVFGICSDRQAYSRLMAVDENAFIEIALALSVSFREHGISAVATDSAEEYNPVHDVCRVVAETAARWCGLAQKLFEVDLIRDPRGAGEGIRLQLDDQAFARKLEAVRSYQALAAEAAAAFETYGTGAFRTEFLRQASETILQPPLRVPYYERVGDERVREGRYRTVLRYGEHVRPVLAALLAARAGQSRVAAAS
jgi:hypothetical protein